MSELKPCPFCGCEGEQVSDGDDGYFIRCSSGHCDAGFGITMTAREWNTRPIEDKLQAEIDRLKAERRWIPVSERLPEDNGTEISEAVLTCYETNGGSGAVTIRGLLNTGMWFDTSTGFLVNPANVTHWMPLPPAPESEG